MRFIQKTLAVNKASDNSSYSTMDVDLVTEAMPLFVECIYAFQATWAGTPTGTLKIQASLDGTTWTDVPSATKAAGGTVGSWWYDSGTMTAAKYIRLAYTATSSTGELTVLFGAKG